MARKTQQEMFGTDPYGILGRGAPSGMDNMGPGIMGSGISVGRVGMPIQSAAIPGQTGGTGLGGSFSVPFGGRDTGAVRKKAKGGKVKKMAKGGSTASKRADGCATKGKTKGRFV